MKRTTQPYTGIESHPSYSHLLTGPSQLSPKVSGVFLRDIVPGSGLDMMILMCSVYCQSFRTQLNVQMYKFTFRYRALLMSVDVGALIEPG